ncbi:response regulator transcription factor [Amycolatopsis sp. K13G38]|uniref:Response regulator transcription factor n=1 Tax=Amycolatopsis acididurans TaxID=2724524 RepID=A0ABX1IZ83_9PSEU|nr:response regulator transcription factor [Amycolatopsis acididurans]NKQ52029.1 response regulator transcription factor [Amycolatopsis acididurans]
MAEPVSSRPEGSPIRLLLVEDHSLVAMALDSAFETVTDIELVGQARSIEEAVAATAELQPDVVLLDRRLPDGDGIDAIGTLREQCGHTRVLIFTGGADRSVVARIAAAGGAGLLLKAGLLEDLLATIRRVAAGQDFFDIDLPGRPASR